MRRVTMALLAGLAIPAGASAQETERRQAAMDNAQAELSVCIAFHSLVAGCAREAADAARSRRAADALRAKSLTAGDAAGLRAEDMAMRLALNIADQRQLLQNDCSNLHTLLARYAEQCDRLVPAPPP